MYVHNKSIVPNYSFQCKYIVLKATEYKVGLGLLYVNKWAGLRQWSVYQLGLSFQTHKTSQRN